MLLMIQSHFIYFAIVIFLCATLAGFLGSLTGLGGGVVIVPMLVLMFGVDIRYAAGASLISVIATSSAAASTYVKQRISNFRIGMFLQVAATIGALVGAILAGIIQANVISIIFGVVLVLNSILSRKYKEDAGNKPVDKLASFFSLNGSYPTSTGKQFYNVYNLPGGFALMFLAGTLSGLLGIGSGALKVLAMDGVMRIPFKVSTATSNFMIGVTAAASAGVYLVSGYVDPLLCLPVMFGVIVGSKLGAKLLVTANPQYIRMVFIIIVALVGVQMIYKGICGNI